MGRPGPLLPRTLKAEGGPSHVAWAPEPQAGLAASAPPGPRSRHEPPQPAAA